MKNMKNYPVKDQHQAFAAFAWYLMMEFIEDEYDMKDAHVAVAKKLGATTQEVDGVMQTRYAHPPIESLGTLESLIRRAAVNLVNLGYSRDVHPTSMELTRLLSEYLQSPAPMFQMLSAAVWFDDGMPTLEVGQKLAASLLATKMTKGALEKAHLPFNAYAIHMPEGLIYAEGEQGKLQDISIARIAQFSVNNRDLGTVPAFFYQGLTRSRLNLHGHYYKLWDIFTAGSGMSPEMVTHGDDLFDLKTTDVDRRNLVLIGRLLINLGMLMTEPGNYKMMGKGHGEYLRDKRRWAKKPTRRIFRMTHKVTCDLRPVVSDYARGTGKKLEVQGPVAGHIKQQPYGPRMSLRRTQFIHPYWRGPEDAPIIQRTRAVKNSE